MGGLMGKMKKVVIYRTKFDGLSLRHAKFLQIFNLSTPADKLLI